MTYEHNIYYNNFTKNNSVFQTTAPIGHSIRQKLLL
nr:MAG TPA: hypothetical protein [Caudoviricetes sp.]